MCALCFFHFDFFYAIGWGQPAGGKLKQCKSKSLCFRCMKAITIWIYRMDTTTIFTNCILLWVLRVEFQHFIHVHCNALAHAFFTLIVSFLLLLQRFFQIFFYRFLIFALSTDHLTIWLQHLNIEIFLIWTKLYKTSAYNVSNSESEMRFRVI